MRRRIGWLSVVAVLGWISCSMMLQPAMGGDEQETPEGPLRTQTNSVTEVTHAHDQTHHSIPAPPTGRKKGVFDLSTTNPAEEKIQAALIDPKGVDIEFIDTPLTDAVEFIADAKNITMILDQKALTEEGVAIDEPLNHALSGIKLVSALKIILEPLGLTYVVEDEVLKITTKDAADEKQWTRVYNTGYLKQVGIEPDALKQTIQTVIEPGAWQTALSSPHGFAYSSGRSKSAKTESKPKNAINVLGDMVVVSAPQSVHGKIKELLVQLDHRWELQQEKR